MKILIDMNLSPIWGDALRLRGWDATHWSAVGDARASDQTIMKYARANRFTLLTHDLDFGAMLALTRSLGPSVVQVRAQDVMPEHMLDMVTLVLAQHADVLESGALIVVDESSSRVRILPLTR